MHNVNLAQRSARRANVGGEAKLGERRTHLIGHDHDLTLTRVVRRFAGNHGGACRIDIDVRRGRRRFRFGGTQSAHAYAAYARNHGGNRHRQRIGHGDGQRKRRSSKQRCQAQSRNGNQARAFRLGSFFGLRCRIATSLPQAARLLIGLSRRRQTLRRAMLLLGKRLKRSSQASLFLCGNNRSRSVGGKLRLRVSFACADLGRCAGYFFAQAAAVRIDAGELAFTRRQCLDFGIERRKAALHLLTLIEQRTKLDIFGLQLVGLGARFQKSLFHAIEFALQIGERFGFGSRTAHERGNASIEGRCHMGWAFLGSRTCREQLRRNVGSGFEGAQLVGIEREKRLERFAVDIAANRRKPRIVADKAFGIASAGNTPNLARCGVAE